MKSLIFIVNEIVTNRIKPGLPACLLGLVADVSVLQGRGTPSVEMAEKLGSTVSSMKKRFLCTQTTKIDLGNHRYIYRKIT